MPRVFAPDELLDIAFDPAWADAPDVDALVVELGGAGRLGAAQQAALSDWIGELPIPVIGVGSAGGGRLDEAVDVLAADGAELDALIARIRANPLASAVLAQVLRSTVNGSVAQGLVLESLAYGSLQRGSEFERWLEGRDAPSPAAQAPAPEPVLVARQGDRLEIVLNSPHNRNALSASMRDALTEAFRMVAVDRSIRCVDLRANGPCFSAGGDLTEFGSSRDAAAAHRVRMLRMPARYLAAGAARYHVRLHGACIGAGIELAAFAGRVTAAPDAFFQLPEVAMGLIPGAGGCVSIARRIGRQRTAWMALGNQRVTVEQALAWGLIDAIDR